MDFHMALANLSGNSLSLDNFYRQWESKPPQKSYNSTLRMKINNQRIDLEQIYVTKQFQISPYNGKVA